MESSDETHYFGEGTITIGDMTAAISRMTVSSERLTESSKSAGKCFKSALILAEIKQLRGEMKSKFQWAKSMFDSGDVKDDAVSRALCRLSEMQARIDALTHHLPANRNKRKAMRRARR